MPLTSWALCNFEMNIATNIRGASFRILVCWSSLYLSIIINVTIAINSKNKFLELKHFLLSKIKSDEGKSCYLPIFLTNDLRLDLIKHKQNKGTMGAANIAVVL